MTKPDRLVVIGASAGGVPALIRLVGELPRDFRPPVLIVLHIGPHKSVLPQLLAERSGHDAAHARDGERLAPHTIRVAPPDHHLLVHDGTLVLNRGPRENL
ncbi:MAG TPA: chemotaxis protein CheB, partial [Burkholderiaceae bacterium]